MAGKTWHGAFALFVAVGSPAGASESDLQNLITYSPFSLSSKEQNSATVPPPVPSPPPRNFAESLSLLGVTEIRGQISFIIHDQAEGETYLVTEGREDEFPFKIAGAKNIDKVRPAVLLESGQERSWLALREPAFTRYGSTPSARSTKADSLPSPRQSTEQQPTASPSNPIYEAPRRPVVTPRTLITGSDASAGFVPPTLKQEEAAQREEAEATEEAKLRKLDQEINNNAKVPKGVFRPIVTPR